MEEEEKQEHHNWTLNGIGLPVEILCNFELSVTEKLLFGYIQNLDKTERGCWATNTYLGKLLDVAPETISRSISKLQKYKYLVIEMIKTSSGAYERRIFENTNFKEIYKPFVRLFFTDFNLLKSLDILGGVDGNVKGGCWKRQGGLTETSNKEYKEEYKLINSSKEELRKRVLPKGKTVSLAPLENVIPATPSIIKKPTPIIVANVKSILDYWKSSNLKTPKAKNETYKQNMLVCENTLKGKMFDGKKYTKDDLLLSIRNYSLAATNPKFQPISKKFYQSLYFHQFIWNNYSTNGEKSLFLKFLEKEPELLKGFENNLKPLNHVVLKTITDWFKSKILGGMGGNFTTEQENQFVQGANKIVSFYNTNKGRFTSIGYNEVSLAKEVCEYFESKRNRGLEIVPAYFASKKTYETHLPQYLLQQRTIREL